MDIYWLAYLEIQYTRLKGDGSEYGRNYPAEEEKQRIVEDDS